MKPEVNLFTIGFTRKSAKEFFEILTEAGIHRLIDARLNNSSQLAGFTKKKDLEYFLKVICNIEYIHLLELSPTKDILNEYKKNGGDWQVYEQQFLQLMRDREVENECLPELFNQGCLLCSEATPEQCHRRLVAEYLQEKWQDINLNIYHL